MKRVHINGVNVALEVDDHVFIHGVKMRVVEMAPMAPDTTYAGPRGNPAVTFNTAVHPWKFEVGAPFAEYLSTTGSAACIKQRFYGADDGDPYYLVQFASGSVRIWSANSVENYKADNPPAQ